MKLKPEDLAFSMPHHRVRWNDARTHHYSARRTSSPASASIRWVQNFPSESHCVAWRNPRGACVRPRKKMIGTQVYQPPISHIPRPGPPYVVSDDRRTLDRAYPTALGTHRWIFSASDHTGEDLGSTYHARHPSVETAMICTSQQRGFDEMAESDAPFPQWDTTSKYRTGSKERGPISSRRDTLNLADERRMSAAVGTFRSLADSASATDGQATCWLGSVMGTNGEVYASWALSWGRTGVR